MIGDPTYLDAESPRGLPCRLVPLEEGNAPSFDLFSLNIEVPAFESVLKFYQRAFGMTESKYPDDAPPVQPLSALLSGGSGPKLLLSPVPDGRLKERRLDEFEALVFTTVSAQGVAKDVDAAIDSAANERKKQEEQEELERQTMIAQGKSTNNRKQGTRAFPTVTKGAKGSLIIDDGLGNIILLADQSTDSIITAWSV